MIGKSGFRGGQDFLPFIGGQDDEIAFGAFLGGFVETAQGVEVIRQFENGVDIQSLAREFLRHGDAHDFSGVDLGDGKCRLVRAKNFGDFRVKKKLKIGAERSLNATKLLGRLFEIAAKCGNQFMRTLVALVHQIFNRGVGILLH